MTDPNPIATLRELHRIHRQLSDLRDRQQRGPRQVAAQRASFQKLESELEAQRQALKAARMAADQKQLQLKSGEAKIADLQNKLNAASSNREYQALQEQIAADRMANSVLEDEILEALGKIDDMQRELKEFEQRVARARDEVVKVEQAVAEQAQHIHYDLTRLEAELRQVEAMLSKEFADIYHRLIHSKGSDGLAQAEGEVCGGCYQKIPPNRFNQLRLGHAITCGSCGRLLYLPEDMAPFRR
jgi:predicted  nucleic acid-binding Zn-ribbon protein